MGAAGMRHLAGMTVAITGATDGIGLALTRRLHAAGARLAVCARRAGPLNELTAALPGIRAMRADVADPDDCERFIADAQAAWGSLDTLVCNAGISRYAPAEAMTAAGRAELFAVNLHGTAACAAAAAPRMRGNPLRAGWRGQIIVVSSVLARRGLPTVADYAATKAAQAAWAEGARCDWAGDRIAVTLVLPSRTRTGLDDAARAASAHARDPGAARATAQEPDAVAQAIIAAMRRPRPEVWPARGTRWLCLLAQMAPGLADRFLGRTSVPGARA
jgi:NAD(P)-dependent dehydrogenase (short-subunit alcohol dehydrogenase family)